ncbi:MAG: HEAT repeat domain-containing protein, partial [candidate division Zixibacteria bacterium]|nr:HEAT repeat domain-containing protein [candidate division Zixibacteria bacterium]
KVFSRIMNNDTRFEREPGRHELPENKWYIIRNSIFVLGLLKDTEGVAALRLRISDDDIRVRREIVRALEKIGGEEACDMLILMADDHDREIQESAVIAAGLVGAPDAVPLFVDVADRHPSLAVRVVLAIGNLGGDEARNYLVGLLGDDQILSAMAGGRVSTEDLKLAVIKSLGHIGDDKSIKRIRDFRENLSTTKKILFRSSAVNKAIEEILDRN